MFPPSMISLGDFTERVRDLIRSGDLSAARALVDELNDENTVIFLSILLGNQATSNFRDVRMYAQYRSTDALVKALKREASRLGSSIGGIFETFSSEVIEKLLRRLEPETKDESISEDDIDRLFRQAMRERPIPELEERETGIDEPDNWDKILNEILLLSDSSDSSGDDGNSSKLSLHGLGDPTPDSICKYVVPYLNGLIDLQRSLALLEGKGFVYPYLKSISHENPITVELQGITDALKLIRNEIVPWRRKHAKELAALDLERKRIENVERKIAAQQDKARIEVAIKGLPLEAEIASERDLLELRKLKAEVEALEIENERKRVSMLIELGDRILRSSILHLTDEQRTAMLPHVIKALIVPATGPLSIDNTDTSEEGIMESEQ